MRCDALFAWIIGAAVGSVAPLAAASCTISGSDDICALVARGDEQHRAGTLVAARGQRGADSARRLYLDALDLYRRASFQSGGTIHHNLLARIARELMFTDQPGEALAAAQECLAQVETDLSSPAQAANTCASSSGLSPSRRQLCQTWSACSDFMRTLSQTRMQSAPQTSYFGFVVVHAPPMPPSGFRAYLAGNDLPTSLPERRFPVVPGTVLIEAEAPGHRRFSQAVRVVPGESVTVSITMIRGSQSGDPESAGSSLNEARRLLAQIGDLHTEIETAQQRDSRNPCLVERLSTIDDLLLESRSHFALLRGAFLTRNNIRLREERSRLAAIYGRSEEVARSTGSCPTAPRLTDTSRSLLSGMMGQPALAPRRVPILAWGLMGAGAAALVTSGVLFLLRSNTIDVLDNQCGGPDVRTCLESQRPLFDEGVLYNSAGNVTLMAGAGLLLGGGIWAIATRRAESPAAAANAFWRPVLSLRCVGIEGRF